MDPSKSISTNKVTAEQKFCTISLEEDRQIIESVPIISIPQSLDTADDSPEPVLRGSPQQANCDAFRFPSLPKVPQNVTRVFQSVPWIFPLAYCVAFLLLLLSVILSSILHGHYQFWLIFSLSGNNIYGEEYRAYRAVSPYFSMFSTLCSILMAITGYVRYRHLDYLLNCAALKIDDQSNSVTIQVMRDSDIATLTNLSKKIAIFKKSNKHCFVMITVAAICSLIAGNFRFYPVPLFYWLSYFAYSLSISVYCFGVLHITYFISTKMKYETFSRLTSVITIFGWIAVILYNSFILFSIVIFLFNDGMKLSSFGLAILELLSNAFFPAFTFITFLRMREFPCWNNVHIF